MPSSHSQEMTADSKLSRLQWRMVITAGLGFFTDAYDLFIIGVVTTILAPIWGLSTHQLAIINGASLFSAAFGAILFGILSDKFGRKRLYGYEILILFFGSLLSATATSFSHLVLARIIVGLGIGGDYPSSAVVASEYSHRKNRGFLVLLVFAMQALGLVVGPLLASLLLLSPIPHEIIWRLLLGLAMFPTAFVFYLRRKIQETPRYLFSQKIPYEVSRVVSDLTGHRDRSGNSRWFSNQHWNRHWITCLIGTAGAWFLLDVAFYGNGISFVYILHHLNPHANLAKQTLLSGIIFLIFAVPGYLLAAFFIDKLGRKFLQSLGFIMITLCYSIIALVPNIVKDIPLFILIFGISFFFVNFGPNTTTFLIPSEIYPTPIRARAHGISAAVGKLGAFVGAFMMPILLLHFGLAKTLGFMSSVAFVGIFFTFLIPEMKYKNLDAMEMNTV